MLNSNFNNLRLAGLIEGVDEINAKFYGRFPYPWTPAGFSFPDDPGLQATLINQNMGWWGNEIIPRDPAIWVAGCGTNQAIFLALQFPESAVIGSDVSGTSLEICSRAAKDCDVSNLELRQESINQAGYKERFDYIVCTGVIHHNADPRAALQRLAAALKPDGVLELMVYNQFHWVVPAAFQQAVKIWNQDSDPTDFELELTLARKLIDELPKQSLLSAYTDRFKDGPESQLADALLQPVLHGYTVEQLEAMAESCGLELVAPCPNQFDVAEQASPWNMKFTDPNLRESYERLPDSQRWQITNLLTIEKSPMLWFYLQKKESANKRKSEKETCEDFLDSKFTRITSTKSRYMLSLNGHYKRSANPVSMQPHSSHPQLSNMVSSADGRSSMRNIFSRLGIETSFSTVNEVRLKLTTTVFPYLQSVQTAHV